MTPVRYAGAIRWKLHRMRAMGLVEFGYRMSKAVEFFFESRRVQRGYRPRPKAPIRATGSLFSPIEGWDKAWNSSCSLDRQGLSDLVSGRPDLFGFNPPLQVGRPVEWLREPFTARQTPLVYGRRLDYRDISRVGNVKFLWELGRHQHLIPLAVAYALDGDDAWKEEIRSQLQSWIDSSPYGMGIHWCSSLEVSLRLISWAVVHSILCMRDGPDGIFSVVGRPGDFGDLIYQHAWFIRRNLSLYSSANNHLIGEYTGLWIAAHLFDLGPAGKRWSAEAKAGLEREAIRQVFPDGASREQSTCYHLWVLEYLLFAWLVGERFGDPFSDRFRARVVAMAHFLSNLTPPGGEAPSIGDSDDGFVLRFSPRWPVHPYNDVLAAAAEVFRTDGLDAANDPGSEKAFWYSLMAGRLPGRGNGFPSPRTRRKYPRVFRESGYAVLGDGSSHLVFDAGSLGYLSIAAHGHADALSLCLAVDGEWWIVDPGTYVYHADLHWRDYFRGTAAHSTISVDGYNQSRIGGPFLWTDHARAGITDEGTGRDGRQWVEGHHDGYRFLGIVHRRRIAFIPAGNRFDIVDALEGSGRHRVAIRFHLAPGLDVSRPDPEGVWIVRRENRGRFLKIAVDNRWRWEIVKGSDDPKMGWFSPRFGTRVPSPVLQGTGETDLPALLETRMTVEFA